MSDATEQAARNNAVWCDTLCRAHGVPGEFHDDHWLNRRPVPPFYPNLVTLRAGRAAAHLAAIAELAGVLSGECSIKDSFAGLDLAPLGFRPLFDATWLWLPAAPPLPLPADHSLVWTLVHDAAELEEWELAWRAGPPQAELPQRQFPPSLLADPEVAFIAARRGPVLVAGAIVNRSGDVAGLSNLFAGDDVGELWLGCVALAQARFPGLPLVGYERGAALAAACQAGFAPLGPLRVWLRRPGETTVTAHNRGRRA